MGALDWLIVAAVFGGLGVIALTTKKYVQGVADFLAANRSAGRYLLTLADGMAGLGAIGIIGSFQQSYEAGLGASWWSNIMAPIMLLLPLTGFVIYRFRESRVMTIAEFYERRYSRRFRIFTGILAFVAGIINYGVFPSVTARFLIAFCGIPELILPLGAFSLNLTLGLVMAVLLGTALTITFRGGQVAIMVTDFFQAQYLNVVFLVVLGALLMKFSLGDILHTLTEATEPGRSMVNPFDQGKVPDFNVFFFLIMGFNFIYSYMAWQGNQGYNCAARTPHDAKMARILAAWRQTAAWVVIGLIPILCYVLLNSAMNHPEGAMAQAAIDGLADEGLRKQLTVPLALRTLLPPGVFGLFVAAMVAAAISTDDTYLHSWGSIFIQDVVMPFRKEPLEPEQHLRWLKRAIFGVAVFVWVFGMLFPLQEYIFMYWAITGAIYVGGAGAVIIGGFYWKRATAAGAWAGMITGSILATTGVLINNIVWPKLLPVFKEAHPDTAWLQALPETFWLNGMQMYFLTSLIAIAAYVLVSLLTRPDPDFDLDRLLHRGPYAIEGEHVAREREQHWYWRLLGVDPEYSTGDKFVAFSVVAWTVIWLTVFVVGTVYGLTHETTAEGWARYWVIHLSIWITVGVATVIWFLVGGFRDLGALFRALRTAQRDSQDDGFVGKENES